MDIILIGAKFFPFSRTDYGKYKELKHDQLVGDFF